MKKVLVGLLLSFLCLGSIDLSAATIVIGVQPNPPVNAPGVVDNITGADMAGLVVTAVYNTPGSPTTLTIPWAATGPTSGAATADVTLDGLTVFSLSLTGDTSGNLAWQYSSLFLSPLVSLELDGTAAGIFFDRSNPNPGTPGSGPGSDFTPFAPFPGQGVVGVTYRNAVSLGGSPPQDDLYARLFIDFSQLPDTGLPPWDFTFTQDTDRVVPEPATMLLLGTGLMGLAGFRRRFKK